LTQIKKYGKVKQTSLRKTGKLFNYTKNIYIVEEKQQFSNGLFKYEINGYTNQWFPSPFLLSVDTRGMVALGSNIQKGTINFNTTFDREAQLLNMQEANRKQAELTPEQLDAQVLQIDNEKKKAAAAQDSNLPSVPLKRSKRLKSTTKTQNKAAAQDSLVPLKRSQRLKLKKKTGERKKHKIKIGNKFLSPQDNLTYTVISVSKKVIGGRNKSQEYDFNRQFVQKNIIRV
jgi:hypothetical protein